MFPDPCSYTMNLKIAKENLLSHFDNDRLGPERQEMSDLAVKVSRFAIHLVATPCYFGAGCLGCIYNTTSATIQTSCCVCTKNLSCDDPEFHCCFLTSDENSWCCSPVAAPVRQFNLGLYDLSIGIRELMMSPIRAFIACRSKCCDWEILKKMDGEQNPDEGLKNLWETETDRFKFTLMRCGDLSISVDPISTAFYREILFKSYLKRSESYLTDESLKLIYLNAKDFQRLTLRGEYSRIQISAKAILEKRQQIYIEAVKKKRIETIVFNYLDDFNEIFEEEKSAGITENLEEENDGNDN